jgi:pilus assembly protein Flp/PilA
MNHLLVRLIREDDAATAVEYAVLLALILVVVVSAIGVFGSESAGLWGGIDGQLENTEFGRIGAN